MASKVSSRPNETNYRWYILALAALTVPGMCLPVLFKEIAKELDFNLVWEEKALAAA